MGKYLIIANSGPEDPNRATVPFLTAKALVEKGHEVSIWLFNNSVYLVPEGVAQYVQAPGLPNLEDLILYLTMKEKVPVYIGGACAMGRGLIGEDHGPEIPFVCGELAYPDKLADLIEEADKVIGF